MDCNKGTAERMSMMMISSMCVHKFGLQKHEDKNQRNVN